MSENHMPTPHFTEENRKKMIKDLSNAEKDFSPYFKSLTPEERRSMLKMGDKSLAFVSKTIEYAQDHPKVIPEIIDIEKLGCEYAQAQELDIVVRKLETILSSVKDTRMVAAENAYMLSLKVYKAFKVANNLDVPGISAIIDDLSKQFNRSNRKGNQNISAESSKANNSNGSASSSKSMVQDVESNESANLNGSK